MQYIIKNFRDLYNCAHEMDCTYQKPAQCPHCGFGCDPIILQNHYVKPLKYQSQYFVFLIFQCTACKKLFTATYKVEDGHSCICCMTPDRPSIFSDEHIENMSPRFIKIYNQALRAKDNRDFDLASIGYRAALEILVKDYAMKELNEPPEKVIHKNLHNSISDYLSENGFINTADVVRILGNDHAHYVCKYPMYDFDILQNYMDIFISLIRTKLLIAHPPVSRSTKA